MKKILKVLLSLLMAFGLLTIMPTNVYAASSVKLEDGSYVTAEKVTVSSKEMYSYAYEVLNLINKERKSAGLSSLTMDKSLLTSAMTRAKETSIYYSHTRPTGAKFSTAFTKSGSLAENIAAGQSSASQVVSSWMNSSSHKANILGSKYKSIGIGCVYVNGCYYWTQLFSSNSATSVSQPSNQSTNTSIAFSSSTIKPTLSFTSSISQNATTTVSYQFNNGYKTITIDNQYLKFTSSDTSVATVSSTGVITGKKAGTATITVTPKESTSYKLTKTITVNGSSSSSSASNKTSISKMTASLSQTSYTYDGTAKKPTVTLKNGSTTLKNGTDYTVSYSNNTNAGTATVKITGKGSYTGTLTKTFTINKASYTPTVKSYTGSYDGQSHTITISNVKSGSTIKYKTSSDASYTSTKPSRKSTGTTTVYYQITNTNYKTITGTAKITINAKTKSIANYTATLSKISYTYTGKTLKPTITLKNGSTTISSSNYTVTYSNNINVGTATVTIKGKGSYTGTITKTFKIIPPKTTLQKLTAKSKGFVAKVSTKTTQVSGYEVQCSLNKSFSNSKSVQVNGNTNTSITISGLLSNKTYYVRTRTFKSVNGKRYYSEWSSSMSVKTK
ncbi:MAG: CAP domain-containing protein [Erysipelotrichaceae bacterium]|nr:CAP domain-containing protein [Erysipelotrichaceae bacterium]